ncbi:UvrD-helicase domain-containing protein [Methylibium sp.]|uniref:UvrD-helicase domain-containing protein n=1 Tax=Methylibium sp. TaxID=2067992 RepID=UPI003D0AB51D
MSAAALAYRIDGALVAPSVFYRVACDPRRSVVVEACAGAGKTWMLVSRILRALLDGAEPQEILAITFTRKAAGEMRERLQDWLHEFARADAIARERALVERGCTLQEAALLAPRLATLYERLLDGGRAVEIRTFHGWFSQLLRAAPLALLEPLGLQSEVDLLEERSDLQPQYWRRFLSAVAADAALREDFTALVSERGRHTAQQWLEAALDQRVEIERADAAGVLDESVASAAALWPQFHGLARPAHWLAQPALRADLVSLAGALGAAGGKKARDAGAALEQALVQLDADPQAGFDAAWQALFTKSGELRKQIDAPGLNEAADVLQRIAEAGAQQDAHETHARLVRLARVLLACYRELKRERGLADMADLEACAEHLLADAELAGWVQQRLDARVRHLLIDEFQDTSPLQWRTLDAWLSGYAGAGGGASGRQPLSVFIVGDPKQSIYRFRRADPRVFAQARDFVAEALGGVHLACDHTRRNAPQVLAVLNAVFERAQADGEFTDFRAHTTDVGEPRGEVALLPVLPRPAKGGQDAAAGWRDSLATPRIEPEEALRLVEARQVAAQIAQLLQHQGFAPGDIQVLCRKRAPLALVAQALREHGLPHATPEQRELVSSPEVRDLVALLDALASPSHDLSLAQALKSPLFGASDDDLIALALAARAVNSAWSEALLRGAGAGSAALDRARALWPGWAQAAASLPPHDLLDRIVAEGEVRERYAAVVPPAGRALVLAAIDALLAQSLLLDGARHATPYNFVRALKRRRVLLPPQSAADAVQLLTIHGAKGLEARAVFVIDTTPEPTRSETATLLIDWPADAAHPSCCAFVASESRCPPSLRGLMAAEQAGRAREELNALYVAMTRAREQLVLSATAPFRAPGGRSAWQRLADAGAASRTPVVAADADAATGAASTGTGVTLLGLPRVSGWEPITADTPENDSSEAARLGRAVHRVLEWLPEAAALDAAAAAAALEFALPAGAAARVAALAAVVLGSPACARFFDRSALQWSGNEVAIAWRGAALRIDRLVALRTPGGPEWWVLDYKLQHAPQAIEAYREQLAGYRDAVQALQPGEAVRAAFITGAGAVIEL